MHRKTFSGTDGPGTFAKAGAVIDTIIIVAIGPESVIPHSDTRKGVRKNGKGGGINGDRHSLLNGGFV